WSARKMAKAVGVSHRSVQRVWAGAGLKPHLVRTFKISNDPNFAEKVVDVVGLYMNPPEGALGLCVDEKTQIQALDRTAAWSAAAVCRPRREDRPGDRRMPGSPSRQGIHGFLKKIDTAVHKVLDLHLIVDNYSTHKTKQVQNWLKRHKRFKLHCI